ncbi:MAG: HNH endonuclease [Imperialibacter sp.]|uniref:HNH endonuclease n=1 Tax=Imperialibacter sp. TaxID=2038411 RepID=UPI0032EE3398
MKRPKCIFCLTENESIFNTKEHIIPESLGSGDWALLPPNLFCDNCQNKFGSSIEQQALASYPFNNFRTLFSIRTKKGKAPWFEYWEGKLYGGGRPGMFQYEPNDYFKEATFSGRKSITIIPAMPEKTDMILRTLLKIGLETFAADLTTKDEIFSPKFDEARRYALTGEKSSKWFYLQNENFEKLNQYLKGISFAEWTDNFFSDVHEEGELIYLHLKLLYLDFITPLVPNVQLPEDYQINFPEPEHRVVYV